MALLENQKLDKQALVFNSGDDASKSSREITCLEATEQWLSGKAMLAEANVELAKIELAILREIIGSKTDSISSDVLKREVALAEAKVVHAEATVKHAQTNERLSEVRIDQAQNERDRQRCEKVFENANRVLKNANDYLEIANTNFRRAVNDLESSTADSEVMEGAR